jgi:hypothetical protein
VRRGELQEAGWQGEVGNWKLETGNWKLELPIFDCRLPIAGGHWKELAHAFSNRQSTIGNQQSAMKTSSLVAAILHFATARRDRPKC